MQNIKLKIAYDGGAYRGWQKTLMGPSIEETLQCVLEQILQQATPLQAASRTDAGVHAEGQVVNFFTSKQSLDLKRLQISLNGLLPKDIVVLTVDKMASAFHPTLDCISKEYCYYICYGVVQLPHYRFYSWHYSYPLKLEEMHQAAQFFLGKHDFSAFCNSKKNEDYAHFIREINEIEIREIENKRLCIRIKGNQFLYKMVRNIVGTLLYVGRGKIKKEDIPKIIQFGHRPDAGITAPAHGLFLHQVNY
jgi:tRNA pseudouridine38-40 synthase